jgi:hypothetical protein
LSATGGDDAEQNAGAVSALGASGEEHVEAEFGALWNARSEGELSIGTRESSMKRKSAAIELLEAHLARRSKGRA